MKIAYICADPGIPVFGTKGASIHIQEVLRALIARGDEITLFAQRLGDEIPDAFKGITIKQFPKLPSGREAELRARAAIVANDGLIAELEAAGPFDLVYERYSLWSHAGMTFARAHGIKSILEVNAPLIEEQRQYRELPLEQEAFAVLHQVLANADAIIAVSPGVKSWLDGFEQARGRVHVVANGVDPERFHPKTAITAVNDEVVVGFLGTLKPWHGVQSLIEAFALLRESGHKVKLSIIGDGPEFDAIHQWLDARGLLAHVVFSGAVEPENVPALLMQMDIAVAPYPDLEGFYFSPLKIYEYMAAGLPVITTAVGHLREVVEDGVTGLVVAPDKPRALADGIGRLLDDEVLRFEMGAAGRKRVEYSHSWKSVVDHILQLAGVL